MNDGLLLLVSLLDGLDFAVVLVSSLLSALWGKSVHPAGNKVDWSSITSAGI